MPWTLVYQRPFNSIVDYQRCFVPKPVTAKETFNSIVDYLGLLTYSEISNAFEFQFYSRLSWLIDITQLL